MLWAIGTTVALMLPAGLFLTCPKCVDEGRMGVAKIGNQRTRCSVCNNFHQAVFRRLGRALVEAHPEEAAQLKTRIEADLFPNVVDRYRAQAGHNLNPDDIEFDDAGQVINRG